MNTCDRCGEVNPADIHTCTPLAAQPTAPLGWQLVPVQPTDDMLNAMYTFRNADPHDTQLRDMWDAVLAAAPEQPEQQGGAA